MQTWLIMIGMQLLISGVAAVMVIVWMTRPRDRYDELLEQLDRQERKVSAAEPAEQRDFEGARANG